MQAILVVSPRGRSEPNAGTQLSVTPGKLSVTVGDG
jgi:hypothetical protein